MLIQIEICLLQHCLQNILFYDNTQIFEWFNYYKKETKPLKSKL